MLEGESGSPESEAGLCAWPWVSKEAAMYTAIHGEFGI